MKRFALGLFFFVLVGKSFAFSSHECDIDKVETGADAILIYVDSCTLRAGEDVSIPRGNGFTNDSTGSQNYLWLAQNAADVDQRSHMLSVALAAFAAGKRVVIRWDLVDNKGVISHLFARR